MLARLFVQCCIVLCAPPLFPVLPHKWWRLLISNPGLTRLCRTSCTNWSPASSKVRAQQQTCLSTAVYLLGKDRSRSSKVFRFCRIRWNAQVPEFPLLCSLIIMNDVSFWLLRCFLPCLQKTLLFYYQKFLVNHFNSKLLPAFSLTGVLMLLPENQILMQPQFLASQATASDSCLFTLMSSDEMKRRRDFYAEHPVDGKLCFCFLIQLFLSTFLLLSSAVISRVLMLLFIYFFFLKSL